MKLFENNRPPKDAADIIFSLFKEMKESEPKLPSPYISPSSMDCQLAAAFKLQSILPEAQRENFQSKSFATNGSDRHLRVQEFLSKTPYWVDVSNYIKEKKLPLEIVPVENGDPYEVLLKHKKLPVRFMCDGLLLIDGVYYVLEIKTESTQKNNYRNTYDQKHEKQGMSYSAFLNTPAILWVYESRDYFEQKVYVQWVSPKEKADLIAYIEHIVENQKKPEKLTKGSSCTYCPYKKHCRAVLRQLKKEGKID